jgi:hypothetical protein
MEMEGFSRDIVSLKRHIVKLETLCLGAKLKQDELRSLRTGYGNNLHLLAMFISLVSP